MSASSLVLWSREEEKAFENAIAMHWVEDSRETWDMIASIVPTKTIEELKQHYQLLVQDINAIEAGLIPIPNYDEASSGRDPSLLGGKSGSRSDQRRKGTPWSEEEHRLFLLGLEKYGKGDWRSISRNFVVSRTPTQVASHAQKYFNRLNSTNKGRKRSSIHDVTIVNSGNASARQALITSQQPNATPPNAPTTGQPLNSESHPNMPGSDRYIVALAGHPVAGYGHTASADANPVMLPQGNHPSYEHVPQPTKPESECLPSPASS